MVGESLGENCENFVDNIEHCENCNEAMSMSIEGGQLVGSIMMAFNRTKQVEIGHLLRMNDKIEKRCQSISAKKPLKKALMGLL